jgi:hypothetical protein
MKALRSSIPFVLAVAFACQAAPSDDGGSTAPPSAVAPPSPPSARDPSAGGDGGAGEPPEDESTGAPYVHFDVNHVVSTGQSNSVAHEGKPVLTTVQPFHNLMFDVGVMTSAVCDKEGCREYQTPNAFVPLVEGDSFWYPVETMSSGLGNEAASLAHGKYGDPGHDVLVSLAGRNGLTYWCLRKGGCPYVDRSYVVAFAENLMQVADAKRIATAAGKSYVVRAVTSIHGESDDYGYAWSTPEFPNDGSDGTPNALSDYAGALVEWQRDYEAEIRAITGQTQPIPLLVSQHSTWKDFPTSAVAMYQYDAHVRSKGRVVLVAPGYPLEYASDCRHYTNESERKLGEYFGKAYARIVLEGKRWEPVRPKEARVAGNVVTARFHVPVPPLMLDTERVSDPGDYGFGVVDETGTRLPIAKVEVTSPDTVTITLASAPAGATRLRYAYGQAPSGCSGRLLGARGNLRDSDTTPSNYGYELFNWAVHFETPIAR